MKRNHERPTTLLTIVQGMAGCAMLVCAAAAVICALDLMMMFPNAVLMTQLGLAGGGLWLAWLQLLAIVGVAGCILWLLAEFVMICGRVKRETAFTRANARALGRIALAFVIGGVLLLPLGKPLMDWFLTGMRGVESPVWLLLPTFVAWAAALMVRAIQVLLRRAVEMQSEQDLTV